MSLLAATPTGVGSEAPPCMQATVHAVRLSLNLCERLMGRDSYPSSRRADTSRPPCLTAECAPPPAHRGHVPAQDVGGRRIGLL